MTVINPERIELVRRQMLDLARSLVDLPDEVSLVVIQGEQTVVFKSYCNQKDVGKLIGKEGRMASALRTFLYSYSCRMGFRAILEIEF